MFTIKLYRSNGAYQRIFEAESFTVLRADNGPYWAEITAHVKSGDDLRFDIGDSPYQPNGGVWEKAIVENSSGRTTEIIGSHIPVARQIATAA